MHVPFGLCDISFTVLLNCLYPLSYVLRTSTIAAVHNAYNIIQHNIPPVCGNMLTPAQVLLSAGIRLMHGKTIMFPVAG